ncbi:MAG TPA: disulfide bond formation protein B [Afifellaceae bacterium]|nr:disulfide bond formation protein B [Afifellaceae bacterium]
MRMPHHIATEPRLTPPLIALAILAASAATVGAALAFEHIGGYEPCALCLKERAPYYATIPVALAAVVAAWRWPSRFLTSGFFAVIIAVMLYGAGLGVYHAGVEWKLWEGPAACAAGGAAPDSARAMLESLRPGNIGPSCTEAVWRFLGLSFAGWNAIIAAGLALLAGLGAVRAYGSSSVSQ